MTTTRRTSKPLVHFVIDPDLLREVDDYRYSQRIPTRSAAIIDLLRAGLDVNMPGRAGRTQQPEREPTVGEKFRKAS